MRPVKSRFNFKTAHHSEHVWLYVLQDGEHVMLGENAAAVIQRVNDKLEEESLQVMVQVFPKK